MQINNKLKIVFLICSFFVVQTIVGQYKIPDKPSFIPPIVDNISLLNKNQYQRLYDKLKRYNDSTSTEVFVAIISSMVCPFFSPQEIKSTVAITTV